MLDAIRSLTELPELGDVHLTREDIVAARQRLALQQQARRWARECVDQARRDAQAIHAHAFQEGYAEGILRAIEHLASSLLESQALGRRLREDLAQAARELLAQALSRPEWLDEMLERWLREQLSESGAVLHVLLPMHCQPQGKALRERLRRSWPGEVVLEHHPQERYVVRLADQLLEFDIETTRQRLEPQLLACVANLPTSVRSLEQKSMQALMDLCTTFVQRPAGSNHAELTEIRHED